MKKNDVKDLMLIIAFAGLVSASFTTAYKSYKVAEKSADVKEPVQEVNDNDFVNLMEEKRIAYYIQRSGIKVNGAITKPQYFGQLPEGYKNLLITIKDLNKEDLAYYLKLNVDRDEVLIFERELADFNNFKAVDASYQR